MFDVIYLSYDEEYADQNFERLQTIVPYARRIHGVKGIAEAHYAAAEDATTEMFYAVDADAWITNFDFKWKPEEKDYDGIHIWRAKNPVNDLVYGYGALKLFPTQNILDLDLKNIVDFTTSISPKFRILPDVVSETRFNTDAYSSWKSAFRECTKLSSKIIHGQKNDETDMRLKVWQTIGNDRPFGQECIAGAIAGTEFGTKNQNKPKMLKKINDFDWLRKQYEN